MSIVNSWLLYKKAANAMQIKISNNYKLTFYKLRPAFALMKAGKLNKGIKRGRPSIDDCTYAEKRTKLHVVGLSTLESQCDNVDHCPILDDARRICHFKGCAYTKIFCHHPRHLPAFFIPYDHLSFL